MGLLPRDLKDANRIVNSADPDQTAPLGLFAQKLINDDYFYAEQ